MYRITAPPLIIRKVPKPRATSMVNMNAFRTVSGGIRPLWVMRFGPFRSGVSMWFRKSK